MAGTLAYVLLAVGTAARARADGGVEVATSTGLVAELFALLTFVLLALVAHWSARRRRD